MQPSASLADELFWEKVRAARARDPVDKFFDGARLYDYARWIVRQGIRNDHPDASEDEINALLRERMQLAERLERLR